MHHRRAVEQVVEAVDRFDYGRQLGGHRGIGDVGIETAVGARGNFYAERILRLRDGAGEGDLAGRGVGGVDGEAFALEPSRDAREVGGGRAEARGETVGRQPAMIIRRRWILLSGEQACEVVAIAHRHREAHRERLRRRSGGGADDGCGFVGMVAVEEHRGTIGGSRPRARSNQSECRHQDKNAQRPKPDYQSCGSSI